LPFSLLFSRVQEYFKKTKTFYFCKYLPSGFSSVSRGQLVECKIPPGFQKHEVPLLQAFCFCEAWHHFFKFFKKINQKKNARLLFTLGKACR
jgi:hypothetical protein